MKTKFHFAMFMTLHRGRIMLARYESPTPLFLAGMLIVALLAIGTPNLAVAVPIFNTVSKGKLTTKLTGSGFTPGLQVQIEVTDPNGVDVPVGSVTADSKGNFSTEWPNLASTAAAIAIGSTVHAKQGNIDVTVKTKKDTGVLGWVLEKLLADAGPLRTDFTTTELADAGFTGVVDLIAVSPNAQVVSETTTFDQATDTITTIGFFDALAPGPVIGTYQAVGTFTNLFDPLTEEPVTGPLTLSDSSDAIGVVVPEPGTLWFVLVGAAGLLVTAGARRRRG